jgi:hypothetical protein
MVASSLGQLEKLTKSFANSVPGPESGTAGGAIFAQVLAKVAAAVIR